jgi:hypothetical protein
MDSAIEFERTKLKEMIRDDNPFSKKDTEILSESVNQLPQEIPSLADVKRKPSKQPSKLSTSEIDPIKLPNVVNLSNV